MFGLKDAAGRWPGTVMGAKNLKAVAVRVARCPPSPIKNISRR
jgi:aldehyde:ferredoxin oxidoreductase